MPPRSGEFVVWSSGPPLSETKIKMSHMFFSFKAVTTSVIPMSISVSEIVILFGLARRTARKSRKHHYFTHGLGSKFKPTQALGTNTDERQCLLQQRRRAVIECPRRASRHDIAAKLHIAAPELCALKCGIRFGKIACRLQAVKSKHRDLTQRMRCER